MRLVQTPPMATSKVMVTVGASQCKAKLLPNLLFASATVSPLSPLPAPCMPALANGEPETITPPSLTALVSMGGAALSSSRRQRIFMTNAMTTPTPPTHTIANCVLEGSSRSTTFIMASADWGGTPFMRTQKARKDNSHDPRAHNLLTPALPDFGSALFTREAMPAPNTSKRRSRKKGATAFQTSNAPAKLQRIATFALTST
mmetsp:Transcript_43751/g.115385  ORF Transcript_43751/g.115385 Transcript_43751/m.115385 type:complete len:202 (-) Transcript_43751:954-1559(-)